MEGNGKPRRLESWKAIAQYLGKDVTTAIRWEREKGLPVHRQTEGKRQVVFSYSTEIEHWRLHGSASATVEVERDDGAHYNNGASPANLSLAETRVVAAPINATRSRPFIGRKGSHRTVFSLITVRLLPVKNALRQTRSRARWRYPLSD